MQRRAMVWTVSMIAVAAGSVLVARGQDAKDKPQSWTPPPFKPVTKVEAMMEGQDLVFDNLKEAVKASKWAEARHGAWLLAELANVNIQQGKEADYGKFAKDMSDRCVELAATLRKRNLDEAKKAVSAVAQTCQTCHDRYRKKD